MKNQTITMKILISKGACHEQEKLFRRLFGASVKVTLKGCVKAAQQFDWDWAAKNLLTAPADNAYQEARAPADNAYREAMATAGKAYREAMATAEKAYEEATATAWKAYKEAKAIAFARCVKEWGIRE